MTWRRAYWLLVAATACVYGAMIFWVGPKLAGMSDGSAPFDLRVFGYSYGVAQAYLASLTPEGAAFYAGPAMWLDTFFPGMFALVLVIGGWWLLSDRALVWRIGMALISLSYALFDYLENAGVARMLDQGAQAVTPELVAQTSQFTTLKFYFVEAAIGIIIVLWVLRRYRRKHPESQAFTVAIDGPAAAGKGTISRAVAEAFGFAHLDTGALYRAVGVKVLAGGAITEEAARVAAETLLPEDTLGAELRSAAAADAASQVAAMPEVRAALLTFQKNFARRAGGAVLDGRDIGTVVCPEAEVKIFVTASAQERAKRRFAELSVDNDSLTPDQVLADIRARDDRDMNRADAPLKPAADAHLLDTTELSIDAAVAEAVALITKRIEQGRG